MNSSQEIPGELIISGSDAPEVLEPAKAALDDISAFVGAVVEGMDDDTLRPGAPTVVLGAILAGQRSEHGVRGRVHAPLVVGRIY
jgi:hypothetical protein